MLLAARDLDEALSGDDADEVTSLASSLLSSALARESGGAVAGFRADESADRDIPEPVTVADELAVALAELEIGEVLLTSAAATNAARDEDRREAGSALSDVIDHLDSAAGYLAQPGRPAVSGLFGAQKPSPEAFFEQLSETVKSIVERTAELGTATVKGLATIPLSHLHPALSNAWTKAEGVVSSAIPEAGALVRAGLRAIARALRAVAGLVPEKIRQQAGGWAKDWWDRHSGDVAENLARRALSASELDAFIKQAITGARTRTGIDDSLREGYSRLVELDEQHERATKIIKGIVAVLSRLTGPLAAIFPPAAAWIYASGGGGMITVLGVSVWIGRDYFDAGVPFERTPGVRLIVSQAIAWPPAPQG